MNVLVIGSSAYDYIIQVDDIRELKDDLSLWAKETFHMIGSTGAGKAMALHSLEASTTLVTCVGMDEIGPVILSELSKLNISLEVLQRDKSITHTNLMHSKGKRITVATSYPSELPTFDREHMQELLDNADIILLNINDFAKLFIPLLKNTTKPIVVDLHDYDEVNPYHQDFIDIADILITSGINLGNPISYMKNHIQLGKTFSIVTKSSEGLIAMDKKGEVVELPGFDIDHFVDSNGAGDAFVAGFSVKLMETNNFLEALKFGTVCGGLSCTSNKLFNTDLTRADIDRIAKEKSYM